MKAERYHVTVTRIDNSITVTVSDGLEHSQYFWRNIKMEDGFFHKLLGSKWQDRVIAAVEQANQEVTKLQKWEKDLREQFKMLEIVLEELDIS